MDDRASLPALPPPVTVSLTTFPEHPCPYLPGRTAQSRGLMASRIPGNLYLAFMDAGFRRSGKLIYQPVCKSCQACRSLRVPVASFTPSRSQRRCWRKNQDLTVRVGRPRPTDESFDLYQRYVAQWHEKVSDATDEDPREAFARFLYDSPMETLEFQYRDPSGQLLAVGICDVCDSKERPALSSVYFYFDPEKSYRGLGTFGAICEIDYAKSHNLHHYYLGFWIDGCRTMQYKTCYQPAELLGSDGVWREFTPPFAVSDAARG